MKTNVVLFWAAIHACIALAQSPGTFTPAGNMSTPRSAHTATLLANGKVLIAGGAGGNSILSSAELYNPLTATFTATGSMTMPRQSHTATLLLDGRVLIAGGYFDLGTPQARVADTASAELYDPSTGTFTATSGMTTSRVIHTATLLLNGKVLIAGNGPAELYDPVTSGFKATGGYAGRFAPFSPYVNTATLLADGKVLITASTDLANLATTELYDPVGGTFSLVNPIFASWALGSSTATLLMSGKVLVAGGGYEECLKNTADLYDALTGTITVTANMSTCRVLHTATLLPDGTVLITGSQFPNAYSLASAEIYDPATGAFSSAGDMATARFLHTATLLPDGSVLVAGGAANPFPSLTSSAELYKPASLIAAPVLFSLPNGGQGAILHAGTPRLASSTDPAAPGEYLEMYLTGLSDGSLIPPQVSIGGRIAEVLWFGNTPGFAGLNQINVRVPSGVVPGDAVPVRMHYIGRPSNEVTIGVR